MLKAEPPPYTAIVLQLDTGALARRLCATLEPRARSEIASDPALAEVYSSVGQNVRNMCAELPR